MYGERLKELRENLNLSLDYINALISQNIKKVESDKEFLTYSEISFLARLYGVSEDYIMIGENYFKVPKDLTQKQYGHILRFKKRLKEKLKKRSE